MWVKREFKEENTLKTTRFLIATVMSAGALLAGLPTATTLATVYNVKPKHIELNGETLSAPSSFVAHNTTYMPLFYVQQLLEHLQLANKWDGSTWHITTPFSTQPTTTLKTSSGSMAIEINGKPFASHVSKLVYVDPSSQKATTFVPIWYIMQTLKAIGLQSTWNGTTWNVEANATDYTKTGAILGSFTNVSDAKTALLQYPGGVVQDSHGHVIWKEPSFIHVDLRYAAPTNVNATAIDSYLSAHKSIMTGLGSVFMEAQAKYHVNANYLVSHALEESGVGSHTSTIALSKNNLYGYGAYNANATTDAGTFPSESYAILFQAWEIRNNYLNSNASHYTEPTLSGMANNYSSDPNWADKVNNLMDQFAIDLGDNVTSYKQYAPSNQPPVPTGVTNPPIYSLPGAKGTVMRDPYYQTSIPVYQNAGLGHQHMFARVLKRNDQGDDVATLQQALNIKADGIFGKETAQAVSDYQAAHNVVGTPGQVDFAMWNRLNLSQPQSSVQAGQFIAIDEIVQGMSGGMVTEWYHVPSLHGWINASDVTLNNVYQLSVSDPTVTASAEIPVVATNGQKLATLHVGDNVVSTDRNVGGKTEIQFSNPATGAAETGYILSKDAKLVQVAH